MTKFLDEAKGKLELSHGVAEGNEGLGLWTAAEAQAAALIAIAEQLQTINDNLDLLRQAIELVLDGEPIDSNPIDAADPPPCPICLARLDKCGCAGKVPGQ